MSVRAVIDLHPSSPRRCSRHRGRMAIAEVWTNRRAAYGGKPIKVTTFACAQCANKARDRKGQSA